MRNATALMSAARPVTLSLSPPKHLSLLLLALLLLLLPLRRIQFGNAFVGTRLWYYPWGLGVSMSTGAGLFLVRSRKGGRVLFSMSGCCQIVVLCACWGQAARVWTWPG